MHNPGLRNTAPASVPTGWCCEVRSRPGTLCARDYDVIMNQGAPLSSYPDASKPERHSRCRSRRRRHYRHR
jgi:hypothetical protein